MAQALRQRGDGQPEGQRHLDLLTRCARISNGRRDAEEDEQGHAHQLGQDGPPERLALELPHVGARKAYARMYLCVCVCMCVCK